MPYCPECLTEYVDGTVECEDCHVALAPGSPPLGETNQEEFKTPSEAGVGEIVEAVQTLMGAGQPDQSPPARIVAVRTFSGPAALLDAELAKNLLQSQGIPTTLPDEASAGLLPVLEVPLLVREEDAARASEILRAYLDSPESTAGK